jgi:hypothetical protein
MGRGMGRRFDTVLPVYMNFMYFVPLNSELLTKIYYDFRPRRGKVFA